MTITYNVIIKSNGALIIERGAGIALFFDGVVFNDMGKIDDVVVWFIQFALSFRNA